MDQDLRGAQVNALAKIESGALLSVEKACELLASSVRVDEVKKIHDTASAMRIYLRQQKASMKAQNDAAAIALLSLRRLGQLTRALERAARGGGGGKGPTRGPLPGKLAALKAEGISKQDASRWERLAAIPETEFRAHIADVQARGERITLASTIGAVSHAKDYDSDEWYTPPDIIERARRALGGRIDVDPASCAHAQKTVKAREWFSKKDDGLGMCWRGTVWLNPPFSLAGDFCQALLDECNAQRVPASVSLWNASTDTAWFHALAQRFTFALTRGRIAFVGRDGKPIDGNRVGQVLFFTGPDVRPFIDAYGPIGTIVQRRV